MIDFVEELFTSAAPIILASLGALFTELAGALGIFIEGFMNAGAFFSWIAAGWTGSVFWGTAFAAAAAAFAGALAARFVRKTAANPFIAGLALNIAAGGITDALSVLWFGTKGVLRNAALSAKLESGAVPWFSGRLPWIWLSLAAFVVTVLYMNHTPWGLRLRASGLAPDAARERGLRPGRYWEASWAAAAFLAALAGAALCFRIGAYTPGGAAGRGWISLAAVYLGFRRPSGVFAAALVFALAERAAVGLQGSAFLPATALPGLPHALALALYAVSCWVRKKRERIIYRQN